MAEFTYKASDSKGAASNGTIEAHSRAEAYRLLRERGLQPVSLRGGSGGGSRRHAVGAAGAPSLSNAQLLMFTEELAELLEAGLKLESALKVIENRQERSPAQAVAARLRQRVRDGFSFSAALGECGNSFDPLYCNLVAAGEASGALPRILKRQCDYLALIEDLRRRVTSSLVYPSIVFLAALVLMFVFLTFLVPQLSTLLEKTGQQLPLVTQVLISVSRFFGAWWWAVLAAVALTAFAIRAAIRTPAGTAWWHRAVLGLPVVGPVLQAKFFAEMLQTLSTLASNGIALLQGLELMTAATTNSFLRGLLVKVSAMVGEGSSLAASLRRVGFFPAVMTDILSVGEQTGDIATALQRAATRYDRNLTSRIGHLTTLIQPAIILFVALFVGVVAYSMIAGILTSVSSLKAR